MVRFGSRASSLLTFILWRTRMSISSSSSSNTVVKPPNVLVLVPAKETPDLFLRTKETLQACLGYERYVVYPLPFAEVTSKNLPWKENCILLIVPNLPQILPSDLVAELSSFIQMGGKCLSMNIQISAHILDSISTRPCIETKDTGNNEDKVMIISPLDPKLESFHSLKCVYNSSLHLEEDGIDVNWTVMSLAKARQLDDQEKQTVQDDAPCCWLVSDPPAQRVSVVSFLELMAPDVDASSMAVLEKIKETGKPRHEFLRTVFDVMGLECGSAAMPPLSPIYLVTSSTNNREKLVEALLSGLPTSVIKGSEVSTVVHTDDYSLGTPVDPPEESSETRSVVIARPSEEQLDSLEFNHKMFFSCLKTRNIGWSLLIGPVVTSTQTFFTGNIPLSTRLPSDSGIIFVAGQQTKGRGRGGNVWISPKGCLMFSLPLVFSSHSRIVKKLSMLQHMVALAVVSAVRTKKGYKDLPIMIKWPNDIYYKKEAKLGGVIVTSFSLGEKTIAIIGCGVNLDNQFPTVSLNDCIRLYNKTCNEDERALPLTQEETLAAVLNKLETYLSLYEEWGFPAIEKLYYQYWMHSGVDITVASSASAAGGGHGSATEGESVSARITGIDEFGYLRVRDNHRGESLTLQPDGNTFDIMKGLIRMK